MNHRTARTALFTLSLWTCPFDHVDAAPPVAPQVSRPVAKRLALWQRAAPPQTARYTLTRKTSLLWEPLVVRGTLTFTADRLELRDDERTGTTTVVARDTSSITLNDPSLPPGPGVQRTPAISWLTDHLLALLTRDQDALLKDARASIPRGQGHAFLVSPQSTHPAHTIIEHLRVRLDPETGALLELELMLSAGDRVTLALGERPPT